MNPTRVDLFELADQRLAYLDRRAAVLAANVANADTPHFEPRDLPTFSSALSQAGVTPERTNPMHMAGTVSEMDAQSKVEGGERSIDGNGVKLDVELTKVADTETSQTLVLNVMRSYLSMFRTAMGR